jgi:site-specific DNA-methyltransferase (adenine-specific)
MGPSFCCPDWISDGEKPKNSRIIATDQEVCSKCGAWKGVIGLEPTPEAYITNMVAVFRQVWRVLRDDGTLWLNLGDSYAVRGNKFGSGGETYAGIHAGTGASTSRVMHNPKIFGLKEKDLCMMPARVAMALQADGWYLRSDVIWHKPNPMPESVTDRPTKAHEYIFLLAKRERYFYDADAIREPVTGNTIYRQSGAGPKYRANPTNGDGTLSSTLGLIPEDPFRNKRSVWTIPTQPYAEAHFATFPEELPKLCILAGTKLGDTVLDPFAGSGTTGQVAIELGRKVILIELNPDYCDMIRVRCTTTIGML